MPLAAYMDRVLAELEALGWSRAEGEQRLRELGWQPLLAGAAPRVPPEALAADLRRHTRCEICGHPLHQVVGDVGVEAGAARLLVRGLPHTAACSCGYARPLVPLLWRSAAEAYAARHPGISEAPAAALAGTGD